MNYKNPRFIICLAFYFTANPIGNDVGITLVVPNTISREMRFLLLESGTATTLLIPAFHWVRCLFYNRILEYAIQSQLAT